MRESERIAGMIEGTRMDDRLSMALFEIARQIALLTERLSDLPIVADDRDSASQDSGLRLELAE